MSKGLGSTRREVSEDPIDKAFGRIMAENDVTNARLMVVELLIDILFTDRLADVENPVASAYDFKLDTLNLLTPHSSSTILGEISEEFLELRLDEIIKRVKSL